MRRAGPAVAALALVAVAGATDGTKLRVEELPSPAQAPSRLPRFGAAAEGGALLSWVEERRAEDGTVRASLRAARFDGAEWGSAVEIAAGGDWFLNWADVPVACASGETLAASFLQKSGEGTYDYRAMLARSSDRGAIWSAPARLHEHEGGGEHGFVSLVPLEDGALAAVWLDGRAAGAHGGHDGQGAGATALYLRAIGPDGALGAERALDPRVCDCCPTAAARAEDGALLVAYRDRSEDERRDVALLRVEEGATRELWSSRDGWTIAGCPVNGPALAVAGARVALVWFTLGTDARPRILCAFSGDGGRSFAPPLELRGEESLGRVDAVFDGRGRLVVSWLESAGQAATWRVARVDPEHGLLDGHFGVGASASRESGIARLAPDPDGALFARTDLHDGPRVQVHRVSWR